VNLEAWSRVFVRLREIETSSFNKKQKRPEGYTHTLSNSRFGPSTYLLLNCSLANAQRTRHQSPVDKSAMKFCAAVVLFCALIVLVHSKGHDFRELTVQKKAKWTIAVYMNGDNELESSITGGVAFNEDGSVLEPVVKLPGDFHFELAALGSNSDIHVVALVDRVPGFSSRDDNWNETRLYYVNKGDYADNSRGTYWRMPTSSSSSNNNNGGTSSEMNMADARRSLVWFIKTATEFFPSEHLYVSAWDHNWGWHAGMFLCCVCACALARFIYTDICELYTHTHTHLHTCTRNTQAGSKRTILRMATR